MKRTRLTLAIVTCIAGTLLLMWTLGKAIGAFTTREAGTADPDLPPEELMPIVDKQDYLLRRADYFNSLRGLDPGAPFDPLARGRAIVQMEAEQQELLTNLRAAAEAQGPTSAAAEQLSINQLTWTELGPAPIPNGQTEILVTPVSGRTTAIAVHPTVPNFVYVGTAQGGLYRSLDGGATWKSIMDTAQSLAIGAVAWAPSDPTIVYVGTGEPNLSADSFFGVGVYRIEDALSNSPVLVGPINPPVATGIAGTTAFTGVSIGRIVVHPSDAGTIFVSTTSGTSSNPSGLSVSTSIPPLSILGLYRSTNATADLASVAFQKLTVTTAGSVAPDTSGNRSIIDIVMEPGVPNNLVCSVLGTNSNDPPDGGVYRSTNALAATPTFTRTLTLGAATLDANQGRAELAIQKTGPVTTVYVASGESAAAQAGPACGTGGTLRKSPDGGVTWTPPLPAADGYCAAQCFYDIALGVDPTNPLVVLLGGNVTGACTKLIARSNDGGLSFVPTSAGVHADNHAVVFAPSDPSIVYMGTDGGIYKSTNGGVNWATLNNTTFKATQFQSIGTHPNDREIMLGGTQDNGTIKRNADGTWTRTDSGDGGYALFDRNGSANIANVNDDLAYHTYQNGGTLIGWSRSTNSGSSWTQANCPGNGIPCNETVLFYAPIALGPGNPNTFYFGTIGLYRSTNGTTASLVSQKPIVSDAVPPAAPAPQVITTIAISPQDDKVRLIGFRNGKTWATTTGATTLTDVSTTAFPTPNPGNIRRAVTRAIFKPNSRKTAYITFGGYSVQDGHHIWKTSNLDTSAGAPPVDWQPTGSGIPDVPVNCITINPLAHHHMYVGTDIGVYRTIDGGLSWTPFSNGLPRIAIFDIAFQEQKGTATTEQVLRVATHGRGIWEIAVPIPPQAVSRKLHNNLPFDVPLPLTGPAGIECRVGGGANADTHQVVVTFPVATTFSGVLVTPGGGETAELDGTPTMNATNTELTINLRNVSDGQTLNITLQMLSIGGGNATDVVIPMTIMAGDTNEDTRVNVGDTIQTKGNSGSLTNQDNFRTDVNLDGRINVGDVNFVKAHAGSPEPSRPVERAEQRR